MAAAQSLSNPSSTTSLISQSRNQSKPTSPPPFLKPHGLQNPWLGFKISFQPSKTRTYLPNHRPITATVSLSLPTSKTDRVASAGKVPKWSRRAIKSFAMAELEARKLKYPTTGTESLLMGILIEGNHIFCYPFPFKALVTVPTGKGQYVLIDNPPIPVMDRKMDMEDTKKMVNNMLEVIVRTWLGQYKMGPLQNH
ncbi:ATP-dependent Clp protease ATP-binding subunit CLPT2, chloroplastic-like [Gossypium australe]|uniref:ATP-dependent Clp protease ATP-binding subunit CLPT2, chloroplastic-like n=1 Tax=Gossypium australe TaxID=47621 RepID=A0A5B6UIM0_9ROSI|nr:ATP-dependent Clp protease ATP-binding subunit CLPT2, chloroplastic-like [Gossypium australe]